MITRATLALGDTRSVLDHTDAGQGALSPTHPTHAMHPTQSTHTTHAMHRTLPTLSATPALPTTAALAATPFFSEADTANAAKALGASTGTTVV